MLTFPRIEGFSGPGSCDMKFPSREKRGVGGCQRQAHNSCAFLTTLPLALLFRRFVFSSCIP